MKKLITALVLISICASLSAFQKVSPPDSAFGQPAAERTAQNRLPVSKDNMWTTLGKTKVSLDEKEYTYTAKYPPEVKALNGKQITIKGFMLPIEATEKFKHFILSERTPTCPYCPPGEPNEIVEIFTAKPVKWNEGLITVTGKFALINNQNFGMFFKIDNAAVK